MNIHRHDSSMLSTTFLNIPTRAIRSPFKGAFPHTLIKWLERATLKGRRQWRRMLNSPPKITFLICLFMALSTTSIHAQAATQSLRNTRWKEANDHGNRYEGTYTKTLEGIPAELVSLIAHQDAYDFDQKQELFVSYFVPSAYPVYLCAQEIRESRFYWMEPKEQTSETGWQTFGPWPVDEVLKEMKISYRNLGVLAQIGAREERSFLPVNISTAPYLNNKNTYYIARIRFGVYIESGTYTVEKDHDEDSDSQEALIAGEVGKKTGGIAFPLRIPTDKLPDSGWYKVTFECEQRHGSSFTYIFWFYHLKGE